MSSQIVTESRRAADPRDAKPHPPKAAADLRVPRTTLNSLLTIAPWSDLDRDWVRLQITGRHNREVHMIDTPRLRDMLGIPQAVDPAKEAAASV